MGHRPPGAGIAISSARGWRRRQAFCRHAASQKRCRPTGSNTTPHIAQRVVSLSLRNGFIGTSLAAALVLLERAAEAVRLGARLDDVGAVGDAVQQRLAQ